MENLRTILTLILAVFISSNAWAGAEGLFIVYHVEKSSVSRELLIRPVEVSFDTVSDPALAVFAEWKRPYLNNNEIVLQQKNKAYFAGLKVKTNRTSKETLNVYLDYTECRDDIKKSSPAELNSLLEATAAAILYTENVPKITPIKTVAMHTTGFFNNQKDATNTYMWSKIQKKWKPYLGPFEDIIK